MILYIVSIIKLKLCHNYGGGYMILVTKLMHDEVLYSDTYVIQNSTLNYVVCVSKDRRGIDISWIIA